MNRAIKQLCDRKQMLLQVLILSKHSSLQVQIWLLAVSVFSQTL